MLDFAAISLSDLLSRGKQFVLGWKPLQRLILVVLSVQSEES